MSDERMSDEEAAKLVANPPTCAGILKPGTPAARMFQDWQRARASEAALREELATVRENAASWERGCIAAKERANANIERALKAETSLAALREENERLCVAINAALPRLGRIYDTSHSQSEIASADPTSQLGHWRDGLAILRAALSKEPTR